MFCVGPLIPATPYWISRRNRRCSHSADKKCMQVDSLPWARANSQPSPITKYRDKSTRVLCLFGRESSRSNVKRTLSHASAVGSSRIPLHTSRRFSPMGERVAANPPKFGKFRRGVGGAQRKRARDYPPEHSRRVQGAIFARFADLGAPPPASA